MRSHPCTEECVACIRQYFCYHDRKPLTELTEQSARPVVDYTVKGMRTLLSDIVYCRDHAGSKYAQSLDHTAFIDKFALHLTKVFCEAYRN